MATQYPNSNDSFSVPSNLAGTALSSEGDSTRDHGTSHRDMGDAIVALEQNAALLTHDHSGGTGSRSTTQLQQSNTHQNPDTDSTANALHHTIGAAANQAASGSHNHSGGTQGVNLPISSITGLASALGASFDYAAFGQASTADNVINSSSSSAPTWVSLKLTATSGTSNGSIVMNPPYYQLVLNDVGPYLVLYGFDLYNVTTVSEAGVRLINAGSGVSVGSIGHDNDSGVNTSLNPQGWAFINNTGSTSYTVQGYQVASPVAAHNLIVSCFAIKLKLS